MTVDEHATVEDLRAEVEALHHRVAELVAERERLQEQLAHAGKMETIGLLAGGVVHDMNNVLGAIMGLASVLRMEAVRLGHPLDDIEGLIKACRRGRDLTRQLLAFVRKSAARRVRVPVNDLVDEAESLLSRTISKRIVITTRLADERLEVEADPGQLVQVLMNLCVNAADAIQGDGVIAITTSACVLVSSDLMAHPRLKPGPYVRLEVEDTGHGMDAETLRNACKPFFTTKGKGEGTGLGLAMVHGAVESHGGRLLITSEPGRGTEVTIDLPRLEATSDVAAATVTEYPPPQRGAGRILLVDDDELIRHTGTRLLELLGYSVVVAEGGEAALAAYEREGTNLALVILDLVMPHPDGAETFRALRQLDPGVKVLLSSGYELGPQAEDLLKAGAVGFVAKPFEVAALSAAVSKALAPER
jgi:signal transduction histidine kinase